MRWYEGNRIWEGNDGRLAIYVTSVQSLGGWAGLGRALHNSRAYDQISNMKLDCYRIGTPGKWLSIA